MLQRVHLTDSQAHQLIDALGNEPDGRITTENSVNLATCVGFLGTRFLPVPPISAHGRVDGDERDWDVMLMRGDDAFVVLQQLRREGEERFEGPRTVSAHLVLHCALPFALESRTTGWPFRVRAALLEVVDWTLSQYTAAPESTRKALADLPAWKSFVDPTARPMSALCPDASKLRSVLEGRATVAQLWGPWAQDKAAAAREFRTCMGLRGTMEQLVSRARPSP